MVEWQHTIFLLATLTTLTSDSRCSQQQEAAGAGVERNRSHMAASTICPTVFPNYQTAVHYITKPWNWIYCMFLLASISSRFSLLLIVSVLVKLPNLVDENDKGIRWLTGFGPGGGGAVLIGGAEPSADSSSCLLMSSVVNRLDSNPNMWMIANLLEGFGWKKKKKKR